jgi:hypothetical protein
MRPIIWRIVRWLGADGNPLRRRTDRIESAIRIALVLAFLIGGPLLAVTVGRATNASGMREVRSERTWRQVSAVLTRSAPQSTSPYGAITTIWVPGRWNVAPGKVRTGFVPTAAGTPAGAVVTIWLDRAGRVTGQQPVTAGIVLLRVVVAEIFALIGAGFAAFLVAVGTRWLLNRRRLARWANEWSLVGPRWTSRR